MSDDTETDRRFLERAIALATSSVDAAGGPFGALVVRGTTVVAEGRNCVTSTHDPTAHAEIVAIRAAARAGATHDLSGHVLYASCEPCPMCMAAIHWARIDRVVFGADRTAAAAAGFDDELLYAELARPPAERTVRCSQIVSVDGSGPFEAWSRFADRTPY